MMRFDEHYSSTLQSQNVATDATTWQLVVGFWLSKGFSHILCTYCTVPRMAGGTSYHLLIPDSSPLKKTLRQRGRHSKWKEAAAGPRWKNISSWVGVEWEHWLGSKYRSHTSPIFYRQLEHIVFSMILSIGVLHFHIAYSGQYLQYFYYAVKTVWRPWNTRHQKWLQKARQHSILQVCCFLMNSLRYL